jgi:hypothetical protein
MATDINTILSWFKTGLKPTQAQFWASWQSFWHKDEQIPQSSIANLSTTLNAKAEKSQFDAHIGDALAHENLFKAKLDKTLFEEHTTDPNAHAELFVKMGFVPTGKLFVFKHPDNSNPANAYVLEAKDMVIGYVDASWITGNYLGGDITQIESFDVYTII